MGDDTNTAVDLIGDLAGPYILLSLAGRSIGGIIPNVTIQEVMDDENTITQHPVQNGAPVSDHVFANPVVYEINAGWSDSTGGYPGYINDVYQAILTLRDTRQPFDVYSPKRMFSNMLFGSIAVITDDTAENALVVRARLQQVIISDTATATGVKDMGNQTLQPVTTPKPFLGGGIGGIPVANPAATGGIGSA